MSRGQLLDITNEKNSSRWLAGCPDQVPEIESAHASFVNHNDIPRSEEHTSELQSLMRISYAVFCLKKKNKNNKTKTRRSESENKKQENKRIISVDMTKE